MFFYFSPIFFWKKRESNILNKFKLWADSLKKTIPFVQKISYLIAFLFFYLSLYWISYSFWWKLFDYFILIISLIVLIIFISTIKKQKEVINLINRSNYLVFSFIYFIIFIKNLIYPSEVSDIFIINSLFAFIWLMITVIFDKKMDEIRKNTYFTYVITYFNILSIFYIEKYFKIDYYILLPYLFFIYSVFYFEYIWLIPLLKKFDIYSKYYWILLNYIASISACILLFIFWIYYWHYILIIFWAIVFNYLIHYKYSNYFSFFIALINIIILYIRYFIPINISDFILYIIFIYLLPSVFIWITYVIKERFKQDNYLIHSLSILFSIVSIILYFVFSKDFQILHISIIFLLQSLILFASFAKLKTR